jgi:hypothetical protein
MSVLCPLRSAFSVTFRKHRPLSVSRPGGGCEYLRVALVIAVAAGLLSTPAAAFAQAPAASQGSPAASGDPAVSDGKTDVPAAPDNGKNRVFGMMPNYATVEGQTAPPLKTKQVFHMAALNTFDPYVFVFDGFTAGVAQAQNTPPSWGQSRTAYSKRYALAVADNAIGNFMTSAIMPTLLRQDPRYYVMGQGSGLRRAAYALSRSVVTRGRSGQPEFNVSEIGGNALATVLTTTYHPADDRTASAMLTRYGLQLMWDVATDELKEFWPDIRRRLHGR